MVSGGPGLEGSFNGSLDELSHELKNPTDLRLFQVLGSHIFILFKKEKKKESCISLVVDACLLTLFFSFVHQDSICS